MLITLIAKRRVAVLDPNELGLVQGEAWAEITGLKAELIGEEVLHLSATGHSEFATGCRNAIAFHAALSQVSTDAGEDRLDFSLVTAKVPTPFLERGGEAGAIMENAEIAVLWRQYFDEHVRTEAIGEADG
jgi:hypothetical protein